MSEALRSAAAPLVEPTKDCAPKGAAGTGNPGPWPQGPGGAGAKCTCGPPGSTETVGATPSRAPSLCRPSMLDTAAEILDVMLTSSSFFRFSSSYAFSLFSVSVVLSLSL